MDNQSDHDLLISLSTKMDMILSGQQMYIEAWGKLLERVTAIEIQQGRNIIELQNLGDEVVDLRKKTSAADAINAAIAAAASAIAYLFAK